MEVRPSRKIGLGTTEVLHLRRTILFFFFFTILYFEIDKLPIVTKVSTVRKWKI